MTQEEMETLADMLARRLLDTFAGRLDMIEEVVFSGEGMDASSLPARHKRISRESSVLALVDERQLTNSRLCTLLRKRAPFKALGDQAYDCARSEVLRLLESGKLTCGKDGIIGKPLLSVF